MAHLIQIHIIHPQRRKNQQHKSKDPKVHHIFFWGGAIAGDKNSKRLARSSSPELRPLDDPITAQEVGDEVVDLDIARV